MYVSRSGNDTSGCGSLTEPCQSIAQAIRLVDWGGHIHLNGTGTERHPFDCKNRMAAHEHHPGISVNKSVTMESFESTPYVSCVEGFYFQTDPRVMNRRVTVTLSGIVFKGTPLKFQDCSRVQLVNCTHREAKTAVSVSMKNIPSVHFDIRGPSLFINNYHCVEILLKKSARGHFLTMNISQTRFRENGVDGQLSAKGLITIATADRKPSRLTRIQISCHNVSCVGNWVPFVVLDLPAAITKEIYSHVELLNNNMKTPSGTKKKGRFKDSMYISRAKKTNARFVNVHCVNNSNDQALRCIKIYSHDAKVAIENSSFVGHDAMKGKGGVVFIESTLHASLVVSNTAFERNRANGGGAIYLNTVLGGRGILRFNLTNVNFTECEATTDGSTILVGKTHELRSKPIAYVLYAFIRNVYVKNCISRKTSRYRFGSVCLMLKSGQVTFQEFNWTNTRSDTGGAIFVGATGGKTDVKISRSTFISSHSNRSVFIRIHALKKHKGSSVTVVNTSMRSNNQDGALVISPKYKITLQNVIFVSCKFGLQISRRWLRHDKIPFPVSIRIDNCTFKHNVHDVSLTIRDPRFVWLKITNSIFTGQPKTRDINNYAIRFEHNVPPSKKTNTSRATIELDRVTFDSRPASSFVFYFQGKKKLTIRRSVFRHCISFHRDYWNHGESKSIYETATGAISILSIPDKRWKPGCIQGNVYNNTHPLWRYDSHVTFEDTIFQENAGLIAGAVYVSNGNTTFQNCSFENNFAIRKNAGQVYSAYGTGRIEFNNCSFSSKRNLNKTIKGRKFGNAAFFYSESEGPVFFRNTSMFSAIAERRSYSVLDISNGGYVHIDHNTTIQCSKGSMMSLENATHFVYTEKRTRFCRVNVTVIKYACRLCSPGYYSLQTGTSNGFAVDKSFQCQRCPLGAKCIQGNMNIAAKENFWGYKVPDTRRPALLKFIPCPNDYCQSARPESVTYNSCRGNRTGFLCGECAPGYTESLFSAECRRTSECSDYFLWIVIILFSAGMAVYLLTKPPLLRLLGPRQFLWFLKKKENGRSQEESCQVAEHVQKDSGYLKIVFYYYQVADLLMDDSLGDLFHKVPFIYIVISAYNFQGRAMCKGIGCPFAGLTAVTKELLLSVTVFSTMANVVFIYCVHVVVNLVRKKRMPSVRHYMAVVLEILLLGYDRLAETSLRLMHCVSIGSERRLFIDGNTLCWRPWQYVLLGYIVIFVVPFIAVLYHGSSKLYKSSISASEFLAACVFPLPCLVYWLLKHGITRRSDKTAMRPNDNAEEVMRVLQDPFRPPGDRDQGTLYWESVLIGRRLILLSIHSFIPNAMLRFLFLTAVCELMAIHHIVKSPFRDTTANKVESVSLVMLSIIAIISLIKATLMSSGVTPLGENKLYIQGMEWFELAAMAIVPALLSALALFAILSQTVRLVVYLAKRVIECARYCGSIHRPFEDDLREPLLSDQIINFEDSS